MARTPENLLRFEGKKIELVIVATNIPVLCVFTGKDGGSSLFADAKTKGFNIEDTHMIDPSKLTTLFIMVTLSMTWSYRCSWDAEGFGRKSMDGLRNHGSEPDLTRSGTGYCMTRRKPFLPGEDIVQSGQSQIDV